MESRRKKKEEGGTREPTRLSSLTLRDRYLILRADGDDDEGGPEAALGKGQFVLPTPSIKIKPLIFHEGPSH